MDFFGEIYSFNCSLIALRRTFCVVLLAAFPLLYSVWFLAFLCLSVVLLLLLRRRQHDLNAAVQRVEAGRLLLERLRGALLQQAAAASAFAASLNVAAETLEPLSPESKCVRHTTVWQRSRARGPNMARENETSCTENSLTTHDKNKTCACVVLR